MKVLEGFRHAHVANGREWPAWYYVSGNVPPPAPANAQGRSNDFEICARERPNWSHLMKLLKSYGLS
eukprot:2115465-Pyramimonas_sp.AAC.1